MHLSNDRHHLGDIPEFLDKATGQPRETPMYRSGLLDFVGNKVGGQQASVSIENVLEQTFDRQHLRHHMILNSARE